MALFQMGEHWIKCGKCLVSRNNITGGFSAEGTESWSGKGVPVPLSLCASAFVHGGPVSAALARALYPTAYTSDPHNSFLRN